MVVVILVCLSAMISGSEVAFFSLGEKDLAKLNKAGSGSSKLIVDLLQRPRYLLGTILITNNLVNVAIIVISYYLFANTFQLSEVAELLINLICITPVIVIFGEVLPKIYATKYNLKLAKLMALPLTVLEKICRPLSVLLVRSTRLIEDRLSTRNAEMKPEELEKAIDLATDSKSSQEEADMLKGIIKFGNTTVKQIMQSRVDVVGVDKDMPFEELLALIQKSGYSRIPVFEESLDKVIGTLYVKDLLNHLNKPPDFDWKQLIRQAAFTAESKKIDDLLSEIQDSRVHMMIVVDEYGGTSGIITLEDILEEVIGDIQDEYDTEEQDYEKIDDNNYIFEGKTMLIDICKVMNLRDDIFDEVKGDVDSLAGLVLELIGAFPKRSQEVSSSGFQFKVISLAKNRIKKVKVTVLDDVLSEE